MQIPNTTLRVASVVSEGRCEDWEGEEERFRLGMLKIGPILRIV